MDCSANPISLQRRLSDVIEEYDLKVSGVKSAIETFEAAGTALKTASCIAGSWGNERIDTGRVYETEVLNSLLKSAWRHIFSGLNIDVIASAEDKRRFEQAMAKPAPFTLENIRATFGDYIANPRANILRGLAEVFSSLDPAYKSHDKVKIGVAGLPKRVILSNVGGYSSWGRDRLRDILNALAAYQGKPLVSYGELSALLEDETALLTTREITRKDGDAIQILARGVRLRRFENGNGHLIFEPGTLSDINRALAEYYGEVLADCTDGNEQERHSTAVAKDLQYYPTPIEVVNRIISDLPNIKGESILEPSCGCGRFLDALHKAGAYAIGIEVDHGRADLARAKGHNVLRANFLETVPTAIYDRVIMNPPFYGRHYANHVKHALKFLKPGGRLTAILPVTARYDHGLLQGSWSDLPFGSFRESGTNINTTVLTITKD